MVDNKYGVKYVKTKFSPSAALESLKNETMITNTPKGMAEAFTKILSYQGFEINEIEMLRWCEFQFGRRYRLDKRSASCRPPTIAVSTLMRSFRAYMATWYDQHRKWLRANS